MNEEEMKKMMKELENTPGIPKPIHIRIRYDKELQKITGTEEEPVYMSQGSIFVYLLQNIFIEHPEIEKRYPPGVLAFAINNIPPKTYTPLLDGDIVSFRVSNSRE